MINMLSIKKTNNNNKQMLLPGIVDKDLGRSWWKSDKCAQNMSSGNCCFVLKNHNQHWSCQKRNLTMKWIIIIHCCLCHWKKQKQQQASACYQSSCNEPYSCQIWRGKNAKHEPTHSHTGRATKVQSAESSYTHFESQRQTDNINPK